MLFDNGHLKAVKNQKDFYELESEQTVILKAYIPTGEGSILFLPPFYIHPSHLPNHAGSGKLNVQIQPKNQWMKHW